MNEVIGLKQNYMAVLNGEDVTYGGNQNFFKELPDLKEQKKYQLGCGMVALTDLFYYLDRGKTIPLSQEGLRVDDYRSYFNQVAKEADWKPHTYGTGGLWLKKGFHHLAAEIGIPLRASWGMSAKKRTGRIQEMLEADLPVILCIPFMLRKKDRGDMLPFYQWKQGMQKVTEVNAHFVMITGMILDQDIYYYRISSWGKMYYISVREYTDFADHHLFGGFLGNILYIRSDFEREKL